MRQPQAGAAFGEEGRILRSSPSKRPIAAFTRSRRVAAELVLRACIVAGGAPFRSDSRGYYRSILQPECAALPSPVMVEPQGPQSSSCTDKGHHPSGHRRS